MRVGSFFGVLAAGVYLLMSTLFVGGLLGSDNIMSSASDEIITSQFQFVDLAGSERLKKTGASGATRLEGFNVFFVF